MMVVDLVEFQKKMSPAEFMVMLHQLEDPSILKVAMEGKILKHLYSKLANFETATQVCFGLKQIYKHDVLAVVLQQLIDQPKLPILFMRTVLLLIIEAGFHLIPAFRMHFSSWDSNTFLLDR